MCSKSLQAYTIPGTGADVPDALAYRKFEVNTKSYFFRTGTLREMSLISSSTGSVSGSSPPTCTPLAARPFVGGRATSTLRRLFAGSSLLPPICSYMKLAMSLKRMMRAGESAFWCMPARMSGRDWKRALRRSLSSTAVILCADKIDWRRRSVEVNDMEWI